MAELEDRRPKFLRHIPPEELIAFLNAQYSERFTIPDTAPVRKLSDINPDASYFWSDILVVGDSSGDSYLIKEVLNPAINNAEPSFAAKRQLLLHLLLANVPVIRPFSANSGKEYTTIAGTDEGNTPHLVEVVPFFSDADQYREHPEQIAPFGDAVGRITKALGTLRPQTKERLLARPSIWKGFRNDTTGQDFLDELINYEGRIGELPDELAATVRLVLPGTRREYERFLAEGHKTYADFLESTTMPKDIVHGDIHHYNTLWGRITKALIAVIDWDSMSRNVKTHDCAHTMDRVAFITPDLRKTHAIRAETFYTAFRQHHQFSAEEERGMFTALVYYCLQNVCGILRDSFNGNPHPNYPFYLRLNTVDRIRDLESELFGRKAA
jgi:Ser/Thr protein kinase RdoA (MazF antagonist)